MLATVVEFVVAYQMMSVGDFSLINTIDQAKITYALQPRIQGSPTVGYPGSGVFHPWNRYIALVVFRPKVLGFHPWIWWIWAPQLNPWIWGLSQGLGWDP